MDYVNAEEYKSKFDLIEYAKDNYDYEYRGDKLYINCPFHLDKTPSCLISQNGYYCFGCGQYGDSIAFLMEVEDKTFNEVLSNTEYFTQGEATENKTVQKKYKSYSKIQGNVIDSYNKSLLRNKSKISYLESRGIDLRTIEDATLGWGRNIKCFSSKFTSPRYVIPVYNYEDYLVTIRYRIDPEYDVGNEPKYLAHPNTPTELYNIHVLRNNENILLVGSELDAAFLYYRYDITAIAPPGENTFKSDWIKYFSNKNVLIMYDNDIAGIKGAMNVYQDIKFMAKKVQIYRWPHKLPKKYDIGDLVKERGIHIVNKILEKYDVNAYEN